MCAKFEEQMLHHYEEEALISHINRSRVSQGSSSLFFLSPNLVAKRYPRGEEDGALRAMRRARQLGILVPRIHRVVESKTHNTTYVVSDRVRGLTLEEAWNSLSWFRSLLLATQLRRFVRRMRTLTSKTAGSLSDGKCRSMWLGKYYGLPPYASSETIAEFVQFWYTITPSRKRKAYRSPIRSSLPELCWHTPLTFSHQDLSPRNMIVDEKFRIWLLDWDESGWYPPYFEYVCMQNFDIPISWGLMSKVRWWIFCWISVGIFSKEQRVLNQALVNFAHLSAGRRCLAVELQEMQPSSGF